MKESVIKKNTRKAIAMVFGLVWGAGCASPANLAPEVDPTMRAAAAARGVPAEILDHGRRIYLTDCTRCHSPIAVRDKSPAQWTAILERMAPLTGLEVQEEAALAAYLEQAAGSAVAP